MQTGLIHYWVVIVLMMTGLYTVIARGNLVKKIIGLNIFQVSVITFFVSMGKVRGATAPIVAEGFELYSNPVPHVLMLTAIVVGVATTALGLALVIRIHDSYGTIEEDAIRQIQADEAVATDERLAAELAAQEELERAEASRTEDDHPSADPGGEHR